MANIKLISMPTLDNTYQNVIDFGSIGEQNAWFDNKTGRVVEGNIKTDTEQEQLVINLAYHLVKPYDYLYFNDTSGKRVYYFITNKSIKTSDTTIVDIECDVFQTYMFDYILMDSFVERCHVPRWNGAIPSMEIVDEGLPFGEQIYSSYEHLYTLQNSFIMTSTSPLGKVENDYYKPGTGGDIVDGDWRNGIPTSKLFRFVKGYEGFGKYLYADSGGVLTIGYGTTAANQPEFDQMVAEQPITEERAAKVMYDKLCNKYGKVIVNACLDLGIRRQNQFDALCSLAYNAGPGVVTGSNVLTEQIRRNPEDMASIRAVWEIFYVKDGNGNIQPGLVDRRKAEMDIYEKSQYEYRSIVTINQDGSYGPAVTENNGNGWLPATGVSEDNPVGQWIYNNEGKFACPCKGQVSAVYPTYPEGGAHNGIDIANSIGTPIYAMRGGTVTVSGPVSGFGHAIYIDHGNGLEGRYGHMYADGLLVKVGDVVKQGQHIANIGNDGMSTGPHLHFDFKKNGIHISPAPDLKVGQVIS